MIKATKAGALRKHQSEPYGVAPKGPVISACWPGDVRWPTNRIPCECTCTWSVVSFGVSRLKFVNASCPTSHPRA